MDWLDWTKLLPEGEGLIALPWTLAVAVVRVLAGLTVHAVLAAIARRLARRTRTHTPRDQLLLRHCLRPLRWIMAALAPIPLERFA